MNSLLQDQGSQDLTAFNLLRDFSYVDMLGEYLGGILYNFNVEAQWAEDIHAYEADLEKIRYFIIIWNKIYKATCK